MTARSASIPKLLFRVVLVTALFAMLGFALGGLIGVVGIIVMLASHLRVNVQNAIWFGALPGGAIGCLAGLIVITISERRTRHIAP